MSIYTKPLAKLKQGEARQVLTPTSVDFSVQIKTGHKLVSMNEISETPMKQKYHQTIQESSFSNMPSPLAALDRYQSFLDQQQPPAKTVVRLKQISMERSSTQLIKAKPKPMLAKTIDFKKVKHLYQSKLEELDQVNLTAQNFFTTKKAPIV